MAITEEAPAPTRERWTAQWKELYEEVIDGGLCTGCAGCVIVCPHDVIGYDDTNGRYKPFHLEDELGPTDCTHGVKGCTSCTRACPRFRSWEPEADEHLFGRVRQPDEPSGIYQDILLTRASDDTSTTPARTAASCRRCSSGCSRTTTSTARSRRTSKATRATGRRSPASPPTKEEVLKGAGSRYTYSANPMAVFEARERGLSRLALVGMGCQTSSPPVMWHRKVGKSSKPFLFTIGLLCSKSFDDAIFEELFETKYGLRKQDMVKMNIKGVFQIWMKDGSYHEINLKECHAWTREGCNTAPTSPPSTPTSPPAASASTPTGRSPSCAPTSAAR